MVKMMNDNTENTPKTFEERVERLQVIITALEKGDVPLEQSVALYKEGMQLSQVCRKQLEKAHHDITLFSNNADTAFNNMKAEGDA